MPATTPMAMQRMSFFTVARRVPWARYRTLPLKGTARYLSLQWVYGRNGAMAQAQRAAARPRRQRRAGGELRDAILAAASDVFFEAGYNGASIEAVIERVGGSKRAIYSHFGGKKELFAALVTEASNRALAALS